MDSNAPSPPPPDSTTPAAEGAAAPLQRRRWLDVRVHPWVRIVLWLIAIGVVLYFLTAVAYVGLLLLAAGAAAALVAPISRRIPGPRALTGSLIGAVFWLIIAGVILFAGWLLKHPIMTELQQWPQTRQKINQSLLSISGQLGLSQPLTLQGIEHHALNWLAGSLSGGSIEKVVGSVTAGAVAIALLVFGSIYFLAQQPDSLLNPLGRLLGPREPALREAVAHLEILLRWWLMGTFISMTVIGVLSGLGYWLIGLKFALALAVIAGLFEFVPTFGPVAAFLIAIMVAATQGLAVVLEVAGLYLIVQLIETHILTPIVHREMVRLPPLVTLFTIILWGRILGPLGVLMAIPLDLTIWIAIEHFYLKRR